jgi:fructose-1-phosphate kinase PfkB-like protein
VVPDPGDDAVLSRLDASPAGQARADQAGQGDQPGRAVRAGGPQAADGDDYLAGGDALLRLGVSAVAVYAGRQVGVVTKAGRWNASLASLGPGGPSTTRSPGALVAGLVPGLLLGWSWPDLLRHAVAVAAAADPSGDVNLAVYERLVDGVTVETAS